jgi:hypothetical protein
MRLRLFPIAAGTALLALTLLATPTTAADGEVVLASASSHPETVTDPAAGKCVSFAPFSGSTVDNMTDAVVELHGPDGCDGKPVAVLVPGESREISLDTEIGRLRARS